MIAGAAIQLQTSKAIVTGIERLQELLHRAGLTAISEHIEGELITHMQQGFHGSVAGKSCVRLMPSDSKSHAGTVDLSDGIGREHVLASARCRRLRFGRGSQLRGDRTAVDAFAFGRRRPADCDHEIGEHRIEQRAVPR